MSNNNNTSSGGIGFFGLLTILFITLKLCNVINWSWWWALSPLWVPLAVFLGVFGALYLFAFIKVSFFSTKKQKEQMKRIKAQMNKEKLNAGKSQWQIRTEQMQEAQREKAKGKTNNLI